MNNRPIGVFDSGLGGLSVVKEIIKVLPNEDIVYLGDTARVPYGTRSANVVRKFSFDNVSFLLTKNVKCVVIACNTSSAFAASALKRKLRIPILEVISPASEKASKISGGKVGVIGTRGTISSGAYQKKIRTERAKLEVYATPCPLFVPFIEEGEFGPALNEVIANYLEALKKARIDTLILACTHYPIIEAKIRRFLGPKVKFINQGREVALKLKEFLTEKSILADDKKPKREFYVTDLTPRFIKVAEMFLGEKIDGKIKKVDIEK